MFLVFIGRIDRSQSFNWVVQVEYDRHEFVEVFIFHIVGSYLRISFDCPQIENCPLGIEFLPDIESELNKTDRLQDEDRLACYSRDANMNFVDEQKPW